MICRWMVYCVLASSGTSLEEYESMYKKNKKGKVKGLFGKILKGRSEDEYQHVTNDPKRRVVMLFGSDALEDFIGKTGEQVLKGIGFTEDSIRHRVEQGYTFKIVVFKPNKRIVLATWDNVAKVCEKMYPKVGDKVKANLAALKSTAFSDIQNEADFDMEAVKRNGTSDPNYMTYERLQEVDGDLVQVRAFLYHCLYLNNLFSGDGYTYEEGGEKGNKEYFGMLEDRTLEELAPYKLITIEVDLK